MSSGCGAGNCECFIAGIYPTSQLQFDGANPKGGMQRSLVSSQWSKSAARNANPNESRVPGFASADRAADWLERADSHGAENNYGNDGANPKEPCLTTLRAE